MTIDESNVDSALLLKKYVRDKRMLEVSEIQKLLENSEVITKILAEPYRTDTFTGLRKLEFLLIELSEIPYFERMEQVLQQRKRRCTAIQITLKVFH
ncbi:MAG: hypothetical protein ACTIOK_12760 [Enterococcus malodoratus]|uniref:hypothetical protein n=1 Tax=Enterococcus malodoratus TaxID=71451 RepID=UPI0020745E2A|nr:hypothetical protein [Enterococcus malodoratus]